MCAGVFDCERMQLINRCQEEKERRGYETYTW